MAEKEVVNNRVIKIDDKKLLLGLLAVFLVGSLFSNNLTGNAGRVELVQQLDDNEFNLYEGSNHIYNGDSIVLRTISEDGTIVVSVVTELNNEQRMIKAGHELYINGYYVTNVAANPATNIAKIRVR